jgi:hypothetical protein
MEAKKTKRRFTYAGVHKRELGDEMLLFIMSSEYASPARTETSLAFSGKNS